MARGGLIIRVLPGGTKTYYSRLRLSGSQIDIQLGLVNALSLPEAVDAHNKAVSQVDLGIDPRRVIKEEKSKREAELQMDELFECWINQQEQAGNLKPRTIANHRWRWGRYLKNSIGKIAVSSIDRRVLANALDQVRSHSRDETRKSLSTLNGCLDYALSRQMIDENPARLLRPRDFAASTGQPRTRWLSLAELEALWNYLDSNSHGTTPHIRTLIKIGILTGARRTELSSMTWDEICWDEQVWRLPAERSKNRHAHSFYLHELSVDLLREQSRLTGHRTYVFNEVSDDEDRPVHHDAPTKAISRISAALSESEGIENFTLHDLRRTCASHWVETLGADSRIAELMLNHLPQNRLVRTYQQGKQIDSQMDLWRRWGDLIAEFKSNDES